MLFYKCVKKYFHKKGVLAAARQGDEVNPTKASSGCQFYIVTGRKFTQDQLLNLEGKMNEQREEAIFNELARQHMKEIYKMRRANDNMGMMQLQDSLEAQSCGIQPRFFRKAQYKNTYLLFPSASL